MNELRYLDTISLCLIVLSSALISNAADKSKCEICRDIDKNFHEGLKKTAKSNFGGGNTKWEEKSLGKYRYSETRLVEVIENLCEDSVKECHSFVEEFEELVEKYWHSVFSKDKKTAFFVWLCIENIKVCCPNNTYGPTCKACPGGIKSPCGGNGKCDGSGTREGKGNCVCDTGYHGNLCDNCSDGHYEEVKNETHTICKACHESCKSTCWEGGVKGCDECKEGWTHTEEEGCTDVNECEADSAKCGEDEYCSNTVGSFYCGKCHSACKGCTQYGVEKCVECAEGYNMVDNSCQDVDECASNPCSRDNQECINNVGSFTCSCKDGFIEQDDLCIPKPKDTPKSTSYKKNEKRRKKSKSEQFQAIVQKIKTYVSKPSLTNLTIVLIMFVVIGRTFRGDVIVVLISSLLFMQYLYWFSLKSDSLK